MNHRFTKSSAIDILRCPACDSRLTQTLATAYAYSRRLFRRDGDTSALPESAEPPQRKSEVFLPAIVGTVIFTITHVLTLVVAVESGWQWTSITDMFQWQILTPALVVGTAVTATLIIKAVNWNLQELPRLLEEWHHTAVCRRCSCQFPIPESAASKPRA